MWNKIQESGIPLRWNPESGIQVPLTKSQKSSFQNSDSMAWNPESKSSLDSFACMVRYISFGLNCRSSGIGGLGYPKIHILLMKSSNHRYTLFNCLFVCLLFVVVVVVFPTMEIIVTIGTEETTTGS